MEVNDHFDKSEGKLSFSGYSWKTNQVGLAIDTIVAYELVTPGKSGQSDGKFGLGVVLWTEGSVQLCTECRTLLNIETQLGWSQ